MSIMNNQKTISTIFYSAGIILFCSFVWLIWTISDRVEKFADNYQSVLDSQEKYCEDLDSFFSTHKSLNKRVCVQIAENGDIKYVHVFKSDKDVPDGYGEKPNVPW